MKAIIHCFDTLSQRRSNVPCGTKDAHQYIELHSCRWEVLAHCYSFAPIRSQQGECVSRCSNEAEVHGKSKHRQYSACMSFYNQAASARCRQRTVVGLALRRSFSRRRRLGRHCANAPSPREKYSCQCCCCAAWHAAASPPVSVLLPSPPVSVLLPLPPSWSAVVLVSVSLCDWFVLLLFVR